MQPPISKAKEQAAQFNAADSLIFTTEKQLKEFGDKLSEANKKLVEDALNGLKKAYKAQDLAATTKAMEALNKVWQQTSQEMYPKNAAASSQPQGDTNKKRGYPRSYRSRV